MGAIRLDGEEAVLAAFAAGDRAAAERVDAGLRRVALGQAARALGDAAEAEDVAQEAMVRLWRAAATWQPHGRAASFVLVIVRRLCIDRVRRRREIAGLDGVAEPICPAPAVEDRLMGADRCRALLSAVAELPPRQRAAVTMRDIEGLAPAEIAERLGASVHIVEGLLRRGRNTLRRRLSTGDRP